MRNQTDDDGGEEYEDLCEVDGAHVVLLTLGAGDVTTLGPSLLEYLDGGR